MRIAYVCHWNLSVPDGVTKKILAQARLWRAAGHEVTVLALSPAAVPDADGLLVFPFGRRDRWQASRKLAAAVRDLRPDLLYVRYDLFLPPVWRLLRGRRSVVEVNSDDLAEYGRYRRRSVRAYNRVNRRVVLASAGGVVFVTPELASRRHFARFGSPREVVPNGILFSETRLLDPPRDGRLRAVFIGSPGQAWHGVDRVGALARALPAIDFDVVGYTREELERSVPDPPANLHPHGWLPRERYEPLLAAADAGIGARAPGRKNLSQGASLKVRDYLAAGLPVVISNEDVDLVGIDAWWLLRLPEATGDTEAAERLGAFLEAVHGRRVPREETAPLVSMEAKEERRLAFLEHVAAGARDGPGRAADQRTDGLAPTTPGSGVGGPATRPEGLDRGGIGGQVGPRRHDQLPDRDAADA